MMVGRRELFKGSAATALTGMLGARPGTATGLEASVLGADAGALGPAGSFAPRGMRGLYARLSSADVQHNLDFYTGFRAWVGRSLDRAATRQAWEALRSNGVDPASDAPLEEVIEIMTSEPTVAMALHNWERSQEAMWRNIKDACDNDEEYYLEALWRAERYGPGSLELSSSDFIVPDYASYEIHIQPGGYVGDRFAGYIYYHGTSVVLGGSDGNYQDQMHRQLAPTVPLPLDAKVNRILDQGTGCGQFALHLKRRFPNAEVWGNDVSAPMLRFAHMRSVQLNAELHFIQELAEKSAFPDNYFDVVTSNLLIHEVPAAEVEKIVAEAYRSLRPGGVFFPLDSYTGDQPRNTALANYWAWRNFRWNHEVWWMEYYHLDLADVMRKAGFEVHEDGPRARLDTTRNIVGYKV